MARKQPGLDQVLTDEQMDAFIKGKPPVLEEPPERMWPHVVLWISAAIVVSVIIGMLIVDYVTVLQVLFVVACIVSAATAVVIYEERDRL